MIKTITANYGFRSNTSKRISMQERIREAKIIIQWLDYAVQCVQKENPKADIVCTWILKSAQTEHREREEIAHIFRPYNSYSLSYNEKDTDFTIIISDETILEFIHAPGDKYTDLLTQKKN